MKNNDSDFVAFGILFFYIFVFIRFLFINKLMTYFMKKVQIKGRERENKTERKNLI